MTKLFLVTTYQPDNDVRIELAIASNYPEDHYVIGRGQWMIATKATAAEVAEALGILADRSPLSGSYVVCVSEYAGRARSEMGEWMDAKAPRWARYLFRALFRSRPAPQPLFLEAKRWGADLLILLLFALMSFLTTYILWSGSHPR